MNRYLLLCAVLLGPPSTEEKQAPPHKHSHVHASIVWTCDICGSDEHSVGMTNPAYKQQFRLWKPPMFCSSAKRQASSSLRLPLVASLMTVPRNTVQYNLLPDLGMYIRGILQRSYFTEIVRKNWVKVAAAQTHVQRGLSLAPNPASAAATAAASSPAQQQQHLNLRTKQQWRFMHSVCANLLLESIPCMKRSKRSPAPVATASANDEGAQCSADPVEIMACINVMHGTLLKLYPQVSAVCILTRLEICF